MMRSSRKNVLVLIATVVSVLFSLVLFPYRDVSVTQAAPHPVLINVTQELAGKRGMEDVFHGSPVLIVENMGQWDKHALFQVWGGPTSVMWIDREGSIWGAIHGVNLKITFPGANAHPRIEPFDRLDTVVSYFIGADESSWHPNVPVWGGVRYVDLYPGVDLEITSEPTVGHDGKDGAVASRQRAFVWRLVCKDDCGETLRNIKMHIEGAEKVELVNPDGVSTPGALRIETAAGDVLLPLMKVKGVSSPSVEADVSPAVSGHTVIEPVYAGQSPMSLGAVQVGSLAYSAFLGGNGTDRGYGVAVDSGKHAYVTGWTSSTNFPVTPGSFDSGYNGGKEAFVAKISEDGSTLMYATFLGGSGDDEGWGIAVDDNGYAYVTGRTESSNFPVTSWAFDTSYNGNMDAFVTKVSPDGRSLIYSTFLGGSAREEGWSIAVDSGGSTYVTGYTASSNFPATSHAFDPGYNGGRDTFVTKISSDGHSLIYSSFLGGSDDDGGWGIAVDDSGYAYVTGYTSSSNFPATSWAFDRSFNGGFRDAFVAKVGSGGSSLVYATFLGGSGWDEGYAIAADDNGHAYVTGETGSSNFPVTNGFDSSYNGNVDAFAVEVSGDGHSLLHASFLGGGGKDAGWGIAIDGHGNAHIAGTTESTDFPTTPGAIDISFNGSKDVFLTEIGAGGDSVSYSTFLGGSLDDKGAAVVVDANGRDYVTGLTYSSDFPTTPGAFDVGFNGVYDAFISVLSLGAPPPNDDFDQATVVPSSSDPFSHTYTQDTTNATTAWDDPYFTCVSGQEYYTVWYRITPSVGGVLTVDTNGSDYDTVLAVWRGSRGDLTSVGCDDDGGSGRQSYLQVDVYTGVAYYIEVAGYDSDSFGSLTLNISFEPSDTTPPSIWNIRESSDPINQQGCPAPNTSDIHADVSDSSGVAWVRLYYQTPGSSTWHYTSMSHESGSTYKATLGPFGSAGTVHYYIKAQDNAGNQGTSAINVLMVNPCSSPVLFVPSMTFLHIPDPYEPNDAPGSAWGPLESGVGYWGRMCNRDDDYYYFDLLRAGTMNLYLQLPDSLVDEASVWVYYNGSPVGNCGSAPVSTGDFHVTCNLQDTGRYLVWLYLVDPSHGDDRHEYMLRVDYPH